MAAGDDDSGDDNVAPLRRQRGETNSQKDSSQWSESCYGIWLKDKTEEEHNRGPVCLGINIVHIAKRVANSKITPANTKGIQIIIEEINNEEKANLFGKDEDVGEDGMISYRAPKTKHSKKDDDIMNQPTLLENIMENLNQRATSFNARYEKYKNDPATAKEIFSELKAGLERQYETGKRLLSYVKPTEKILQVNTFFQNHYENVMNWLNEKSEK